MCLNLQQKKQLKKDIKNLNKNEYIEIFKIIINNNIKYTENKNGIFFNLKYLNDNVVKKIYSFVEFSKINKTKNNLNNEKRNNELKYFNKQQFKKTNDLETIKELSFEKYVEKYNFNNSTKNDIIKYQKTIFNKYKTKITSIEARLIKKCKNISENKDNLKKHNKQIEEFIDNTKNENESYDLEYFV